MGARGVPDAQSRTDLRVPERTEMMSLKQVLLLRRCFFVFCIETAAGPSPSSTRLFFSRKLERSSLEERYKNASMLHNSLALTSTPPFSRTKKTSLPLPRHRHRRRRILLRHHRVQSVLADRGERGGGESRVFDDCWEAGGFGGTVPTEGQYDETRARKGE
jgi:hypothetical protein